MSIILATNILLFTLTTTLLEFGNCCVNFGLKQNYVICTNGHGVAECIAESTYCSEYLEVNENFGRFTNKVSCEEMIDMWDACSDGGDLAVCSREIDGCPVGTRLKKGPFKKQSHCQNYVDLWLACWNGVDIYHCPRLIDDCQLQHAVS